MNNVNDQVELFNSSTLYLYDKYVPLRPIKNAKSNAPWMTKEVQELIVLREYAFKLWLRVRSKNLRSIYSRIRNKVTSLIRITKQNFLNHKLKTEQSPRMFWRTVNQLGIGKSSDFCISEFQPKDFVNEFLPVTPAIEIDKRSELIAKLFKDDFIESTFRFQIITLPTLTKALYSIKSNSTGLDGISIRFIKIIFPFIGMYLLTIINNIITTGIFPNIWKRAKLLPIPKVSNPTVVSQFRPISILSSLSKLLERVMSNQIINYIDDFNLLDTYQSAYRSHHNTASAVLNVVDDIRRNADKDKVSVLVLLDFSKAFDRVAHEVLLYKLKEKFKFGASALSLIHNYLSNRTSVVFVRNNFSDGIAVHFGVPQGSVLGPLLFLMYINDLSKSLSMCRYHLFADDVQVYSSCSVDRINECIEELNIEINNISKWATENNLVLNAKKTQAIVIYRNCIETTECVHIKVGNEIINFSSYVRNLGITINKTLNWDDHILSITGKVYSSLRCLWTLTKFASPELRKKLFLAYVFPSFIYGDAVFYGMQDYNLQKLRMAFSAGVRYIFNLRKFDHISAFLNQIIGCTIGEYYEFRVVALMYKLLKYDTPIYLAEKLLKAKSMRSGNLLVPCNKYDILNHSFYVQGICLWNSLPLSLRMVETYNSFKHQYFNRMFPRL